MAAPSLAGRAVLAVVLLIGFYLLALGIAGGLLWLPYAEWTYANRIHPKLALLCIAGAGIILWSIVPRFDHFEAPGPTLTEDDQPKLFALIKRVARKTGQSMPVEVYLVPEVNAWVAQRGGIMGFGSRRVMGLGLPLMQLLTLPELEAVLAHEFGHYTGGDTSLGPWIYKTRGALGRTINNLHEAESVLHKPFEWYGSLFLRITLAISRAQEYAADALAAEVVGSAPLMSGLKAVHGGGLAFGAYWEDEYLSVANAGFRPPLAEGFATFMTGPLKSKIDEAVHEALKDDTADPYDSHPPLKARLAALEAAPSGNAGSHGPPSESLLLDVPGLEVRILEHLAGADTVRDLKVVPWAEVGHVVYEPQWRESAEKHRRHLEGLTPETMPTDEAGLAKLGQAMAPQAMGAPPALLANHAQVQIAAAMTVALLDRGWTAAALPGEPILLRLGEDSCEPFVLVEKWVEGSITAEEWSRRLAVVGLSGLDLGAAPVGAATSPLA